MKARIVLILVLSNLGFSIGASGSSGSLALADAAFHKSWFILHATQESALVDSHFMLSEGTPSQGGCAWTEGTPVESRGVIAGRTVGVSIDDGECLRLNEEGKPTPAHRPGNDFASVPILALCEVSDQRAACAPAAAISVPGMYTRTSNARGVSEAPACLSGTGGKTFCAVVPGGADPGERVSDEADPGPMHHCGDDLCEFIEHTCGYPDLSWCQNYLGAWVNALADPPDEGAGAGTDSSPDIDTSGDDATEAAAYVTYDFAPALRDVPRVRPPAKRPAYLSTSVWVEDPPGIVVIEAHTGTDWHYDYSCVRPTTNATVSDNWYSESGWRRKSWSFQTQRDCSWKPSIYRAVFRNKLFCRALFNNPFMPDTVVQTEWGGAGWNSGWAGAWSNTTIDGGCRDMLSVHYEYRLAREGQLHKWSSG